MTTNVAEPQAHPASHEHIDPVFKQIMEVKLSQMKAGVQTEVEVNRMPLAIDAIVTVDTEEARQHLENETPFFYFLPCNQVEFKGVEDPFTVREYHRVFGRTNLYLSEHDVEPDKMTVTIICANKPRNVLTYQQIRDRFRRIQPGYYRSANRPNIYLIVIRELPPIPKNYMLLLFTGDAAQFRTCLEQMLAEGNISYLPYAWRTRPELTREVMKMKRRNGKMTYEESLHLFVDDFGDDIIHMFPLEKRLQGLEPEQRLQGLDPEQRLQGLDPEQRLQGLDPEQRLQGLDPVQRLAGLTSEQILTALSQKHLLNDLGKAYLAQQLSLEERKTIIEQLLQSLLAAIPDQTAQPATPA